MNAEYQTSTGTLKTAKTDPCPEITYVPAIREKSDIGLMIFPGGGYGMRYRAKKMFPPKRHRALYGIRSKTRRYQPKTAWCSRMHCAKKKYHLNCTSVRKCIDSRPALTSNFKQNHNM